MPSSSAWWRSQQEEPAPEHGPKTILAIAHEPPIGKLIAVNLKRQGYRVVSVETAEAALTILQKTPPDLIVLDMGIADADPYELATEVRRKPDWYKIPIIGLVPPPLPAAAELRQAGVSSWLPMPFNPMELTAFVKRHMKQLVFSDRLSGSPSPGGEVFKV